MTGRPSTTAEPRMLRRSARYRHMTESGCSVKVAESACTHPVRYAETMRARGVEPLPELARVVIGGHPRHDDTRSLLRRENYHLLRVAGANGAFASDYCRTPNMYARGLRILAGEESE